MRFHLLASGSKGNCCIVENKDTRIVIDCGSTMKYLKQCFQELNYDLNTLDALLITHTHKDHISCLKLFKHVPTYAEEILDVDFQKRIHEDECFQINSLRIKSIRLSHDQKCLGYIIEDDHEKLVYVTDTGYFKEQYYDLIKGADYYIFECNHDLRMLIKSNRPEYVKNRIRSAEGHLCNEDCALHLKKSITEKTKHIVLAHISEEANTYELALSVVKENLKNEHFIVQAAKQFEIIQGGTYD